MFAVNELLVQVRDGSIDVRPRLVALDVEEHKAYFSDGTSEHVRLLNAVMSRSTVNRTSVSAKYFARLLKSSMLQLNDITPIQILQIQTFI